MITNGLIAMLYLLMLLFTAPLRVLADVTANSSVVSAILTANGLLAGIPFPLFLISVVGSLSFYVVFEAFYWGYKLVRWLYRKVPGIS